MNKLIEMEALRKKEWRTFLFKKHWFLNSMMLILLLGCLYNLTRVLFPELFLPENIEVLSFQTEEEAFNTFIHRTQEGGIILGFALGSLFVCFALFKVHLYYNQFVRIRALTPYKLAYNEWLVENFEGNLTFHKGPIDFPLFNKSRLYQGLEVDLVTVHEKLNVPLYRSLGSFRGIWKRTTMQVGNVQQFFAYQDKGITKSVVGFDVLFISITLPDSIAGELIIKRDKTEKKGLKSLQKSKTKWGDLIRLEDPAFENGFKIYGSKSLADKCLNSNIRQALLFAQNNWDKNISISITDGTFNIAMPNMTGLLNPSVARKVNVKNIKNQLKNISNLISELDLNPQRGHAV